MKLICILFLTLVINEVKSEWQIRKDSSDNENKCPSVGVINGNKTSITKYPFMASIKVNGKLFGAGVILCKHWILTIAYNVVWTNYSLEIRVGSSKYNKGGQTLKVEKIFIHPDFVLGNQSSNVAMVRLAEEIKFGKKAKPVNLGTKDLMKGTKAVVSGWGANDHSGEPSPNLLAGTVTVMAWKPCNKNYSGELSRSIMCTFDLNAGPALRWGAMLGEPFSLSAPPHESRTYAGIRDKGGISLDQSESGSNQLCTHCKSAVYR